MVVICMNKKGFTLVELLAVIVILAVIALIATPIVLNLIKTAKKGDIWLHVQKAPGSHVLLQSKNGEVSDEAIVEAAETAAFFSSVKSSTVVTVDYTDAKNIKKPNGAKPGFVVYYTYYSVNVKPKEPKKR